MDQVWHLVEFYKLTGGISLQDEATWVALPRIELGSGASETLILSIVLQSHGRKCKRNKHCLEI